MGSTALEPWPAFGHIHGDGRSHGERVFTFEEPDVACGERCREKFLARVRHTRVCLMLGVSRRALIELHGHVVVDFAEDPVEMLCGALQ